MQPDQTPEGGKFRATAAAALDGVAGVWGNGDMLCVQFDGSGNLILSGIGDNCEGVIWTSEGRKTSEPPLAADKKVIGGRKYTVFTYAQFVEAETASVPALSAGDALYAIASGGVTAAPVALDNDIYVGTVLAGGSRLLINVNGRPVSP